MGRQLLIAGHYEMDDILITIPTCWFWNCVRMGARSDSVCLKEEEK